MFYRNTLWPLLLLGSASATAPYTWGNSETVEIQPAPAALQQPAAFPWQALSTTPTGPERLDARPASYPPLDARNQRSSSSHSTQSLRIKSAQTPPEEQPFQLSRLELGMPRTQAYSYLHQQFEQLQQRTISAFETRLVLPSTPSNGHIHTSYRLLMARRAPEQLGEIQISWVSAINSSSALHSAVLNALEQAFGKPLQWHTLLVDVIQHTQQQIAEQQTKVDELAQKSERTPTLILLKNAQQRRLARQRHEQPQITRQKELSANTVCSALKLQHSDCQLANPLVPAKDGSLSSKRRNCRYWLKSEGEMLSACEMGGGTMVRLTRPEPTTQTPTVIVPL